MNDDRRPGFAFSCPHHHYFLSDRLHANERRTWWLIALTATTMAFKIVSGLLFGSMALLADGWHMASHASAMGVTSLAYYMSRKHKDNPRFTFGTGKIGDLAGYSSALLLLVLAVFMAYESIVRLVHPVDIHFKEAMVVASIGLLVNLASALILREHQHDSEADHHDHDHNLRAAYLHVLADATTSILAIAALAFGMFLGWSFLDPVMGIAGALLISHWSYGLMREAGGSAPRSNAGGTHLSKHLSLHRMHQRSPHPRPAYLAARARPSQRHPLPRDAGRRKPGILQRTLVPSEGPF